MELDRVAAVLRPRRSWEGLDLGFLLGRTWFRSLWTLWLIGLLPMALLWLPLTGPRAHLWTLALWWLKPLYEAPLVYWTGRALFGERLPLRALPSILRASWTRRLLPFLLWRRLSPSRSFALPIALLEGLHGRAARQRRRVLGDGDGTAAWLTLVCYHFEAILWGGLLLTLFALVPQGLPRIDLGGALTESGSWPYWTSSLLYLLAMSIVAPFYVCAGFAHYLTRRTALEAWDLDLAFRQIQASAAGPADGPPRGDRPPGDRPRNRAPVALCLLLGLVALPRADLGAAELPTPQRARATIAEVLAHDDFGRSRETTVWVPIVRRGLSEPPAGDRRIGELAAAVGTFLKWLLLAGAASALLLLARRILRDWRPPRGPGRRPRGRGEIQGLPGGARDPAADPLPADLAAAVRARLAAGDPRGALTLLYRGGLQRLVGAGARIPAGATEGDCLALAARHLDPARLAPFRRLTRDWQGLAYAGRVPDAQTVAERLAECLAEGAPDAAGRGDADGRAGAARGR